MVGVRGKGPYQVRVLAPGFAAATTTVPESSTELTVDLHLATGVGNRGGECYAHSGPSAVGGSRRGSLNGEQLKTMLPVAASDAVRFLPGAVVNDAGQRGGLTSLFVRGGESNYNKVIVDGVTVNEPGGTFDFGTLWLAQGDRMEFLRGAQSTLYGSDAITSVVQVWTRTGSTRVPELSFRRRTREILERERERFAGGSARTLRLQPLRR